LFGPSGGEPTGWNLLLFLRVAGCVLRVASYGLRVSAQPLAKKTASLIKKETDEVSYKMVSA
jgi:fructose-1,6-bisphosphatase